MSGLSSVYPPPPPFYKYFTAENLNLLKDVESLGDDEKKTKLADEPLKYLVPPEPPTSGSYSSFGNVWQVDDTLLTLEEAGIPQLYHSIEESADSVQANHQSRVWELKKLLKSVLINFLELVKLMPINPEKFPEKLEDIRIILINMHHLLNEYRPHQARESLILLMEDQIQKSREEIEEINKSTKEIHDDIKTLASGFISLKEGKVPKEMEEKSEEIGKGKESQKELDLKLWSLIEG